MDYNDGEAGYDYHFDDNHDGTLDFHEQTTMSNFYNELDHDIESDSTIDCGSERVYLGGPSHTYHTKKYYSSS